jgi:hypothetical protein
MSPSWSRARVVLALLVVPVLLFGPLVAAGEVFLPFLPAAHEPLASEDPAAAAEALRDVNATMGDRVYPFLVDQLSARAELLRGAAPTWEPLQTLGMPLFAGNVAALGYPPNWLAFLISPERMAAPLAALSLFLAGLGAWLFLTRLELDRRAALVGALGMQLGAFALTNLHYYMKVDSALWFPWALWAVEGLARGKRWSAIALVLALALALLGGMVTIGAFVFAGTALYALVRLGPFAPQAAERRSPLLAAGVCFVLGGALAAYWVLPLAESAANSSRGAVSFEGTVATSLAPTTALGLFVPDLVGPPGDPTPSESLPLAWWLTPAAMAGRAEHASTLEWDLHARLALVLLGLVGVVARPRRAAFPALLLVLCVGFAQAWPLVRWLYHVPGFDLGAPGRVLALAWFLWPWLAALGVEALLARAPRALATLVVASFAVALAASLAWKGLEPAEFARGIQETILARYPGLVTRAEVLARLPLERCLAAAEHLSSSLARTFAGAAALFVAGMLALFLDRRPGAFEEGPRRRALVLGLVVPLLAGLLPFLVLDDFGARGPLALLALSGVAALSVLALATPRAELALWFPPLALLVLEGFLGAHGHVRGRSVLSDGLFPPSPTLEVVREAAGDGRVLRLDTSGTLAEALALARPNMLVPYGIADLTPYPTFTPKTAVELVRALDARMSFKNHVAPLPELALVDRPLLDLLRVTCVLSVRPVQHARLVPLMERAGFCVYRRLGALPAARLVPRAVLGEGLTERELLAELAGPEPDYAGRVRLAPEASLRLDPAALTPVASVGEVTAVEHPAKNRVTVRVRGSTGGWLVLHEQWAPGWTCTAGELELPVFRADHAYRAVPLPTGELVLEFRYAPRSLDWGLALALGALLLVLGYELLNRN